MNLKLAGSFEGYRIWLCRSMAHHVGVGCLVLSEGVYGYHVRQTDRQAGEPHCGTIKYFNELGATTSARRAER